MALSIFHGSEWEPMPSALPSHGGHGGTHCFHEAAVARLCLPESACCEAMAAAVVKPCSACQCSKLGDCAFQNASWSTCAFQKCSGSCSATSDAGGTGGASDPLLATPSTAGHAGHASASGGGASTAGGATDDPAAGRPSCILYCASRCRLSSVESLPSGVVAM